MRQSKISNLTKFLLGYGTAVTAALLYVVSTYPAAASFERSPGARPTPRVASDTSRTNPAVIDASQPVGTDGTSEAPGPAAPPAACPVTTWNDPAVDEDMLQQQIGIDLYRYSRVTRLTADQKSRISFLMRKIQKEAEPVSDDPNAPPTVTDGYQREIDAIVGEKALIQLGELETAESDRDALQRAEAQAAYLQRALGLPESKFEQLVNAMGSESREIEEQVSFRTRELRLNTEQEAKLREFWRQGDDTTVLEDFVNERGPESFDPSFYPYASSAHSPDWQKVRRLFVATRLRGFLSDAQYEQLRKLDSLP